MSKMSSHDPFECLKHKLWPKEGVGVKVPIWLLLIKSRKSPWNKCVQVTCHISLEIFRWGLQFCSKPHFNQRYAQEVMAFQNVKSPNFNNFGTLNLGVPGQNEIWMKPLWLIIENTIRGKVMASLKFGLWWILWVHVCLWFVRALKVFQLCTNQLVVWFVQVRVNNWPTCHFS